MLDTRALMLQGGENGPALVPGHPEKSLLIKSVNHENANLKMPRSAYPKLSAPDIATSDGLGESGRSVERCADETGGAQPGKITDEDRRYWAFQQIKAGRLPAGDATNPIDRFIAARLQKPASSHRPPLIRAC